VTSSLPPAHRSAQREGGRVFRTAKWYRVLSAFATIAICGAGVFYVMNGTAAWQRAGGAALIAFGLAGFLDVLMSRVVLTADDIQVISLVRTRTYPRSDLESAKVDGGAVCLKKRDGGWLVLPDSGGNALSVRNAIDAWIKKGRD
jgi:hypothetical protein